MKLFDSKIVAVAKEIEKQVKSVQSPIQNKSWEKLNVHDFVMKSDTAIELGSPKTSSTSFSMWTIDEELVKNDEIIVIGEELENIVEPDVDYAKITLVKLKDYDEDDAYDIFRKVENIRMNLNLKGYMIRATTQRAKEWCRVSKEALAEGFSFGVLGSEIIKAYKEIDCVENVKVIFITGNKNLINTFISTGKEVNEITKALNKIFDDIEFDCNSCDFEDVCSEIDGMKDMHKKQSLS